MNRPARNKSQHPQYRGTYVVFRVSHGVEYHYVYSNLSAEVRGVSGLARDHISWAGLKYHRKVP